MAGRLKKALESKAQANMNAIAWQESARQGQAFAHFISESASGPVLDKIQQAVTTLVKRIDSLESTLESKTSELLEMEKRVIELESRWAAAIEKIDVRPMVNIPPQEKPNLNPILDAIKAIRLEPTDLSQILEAVQSIELPAPAEQKPVYWKLVHHRDVRGRITETEAFAE